MTSNVQPRPHPNLFQITEVQFCGRIVIVVEIEPGVGEVWQAKDHKYYKRFHYKVEPMTHDEINEVRRRKAVPDMWVVFGFDERWVKTLGDDHQELVSIIVGIQNETDSPVESADIELGVPRTGYLLAPSGGPLRPVPFEEAGCRLIGGISENPLKADWYKLRLPSQDASRYPLDGPIYRMVEPRPVSLLSIKSPFSLGPTPLSLGLKFDVVKGWLVWRIQAPGAASRQGVTQVIQERIGLGLRLDDLDTPFDIL